MQESSNAERLAIEKKKLEEEAKKKAELEEEQRRIAAENAAKKYAFCKLNFSYKLLTQNPKFFLFMLCCSNDFIL